MDVGYWHVDNVFFCVLVRKYRFRSGMYYKHAAHQYGTFTHTDVHQNGRYTHTGRDAHPYRTFNNRGLSPIRDVH